MTYRRQRQHCRRPRGRRTALKELLFLYARFDVTCSRTWHARTHTHAYGCRRYCAWRLLLRFQSNYARGRMSTRKFTFSPWLTKTIIASLTVRSAFVIFFLLHNPRSRSCRVATSRDRLFSKTHVAAQRPLAFAMSTKTSNRT